MADRVRIRVHRSGVRAMLQQPFMLREVERRAERVQWVAQQIAPVRTGRYRASIAVSSGTRPSGVYARVTAHAPYSYFIERGTRKMRAQHVLARALKAAGD